ncbi:hypothetical protein P170DRAFT_432568 [Aspergillus steynii IBT 23096]|uniref:Secreted protein n=1 Tax=Aspergillus steynii IBT 23096 TaxID=1392250 RepID=A0A2I2GQ98_9EURO|nr:uncharacterized protein P170DRAFT_432568 [Aspergillus steynii IBT 23096]PLB55040.1 hypothetical protein P170DRAFT_432568 [Aspergillus steynii IBT 23096]
MPASFFLFPSLIIVLVFWQRELPHAGFHRIRPNRSGFVMTGQAASRVSESRIYRGKYSPNRYRTASTIMQPDKRTARGRRHLITQTRID